MRIFFILLSIFIICSCYANATTIDNASNSITAASVSAVAPASQAVSYKYYDKPWLMDPPPKELTLNEYKIGLEEQNYLFFFAYSSFQFVSKESRNYSK